MRKAFQFTVVFGIAAICAFAARPIATVTSAQPFALDGQPINTPGVSSFPVVVGDTVTTAGSPAILVFPEGSTIKLAPNSAVRISGADSRPKVVLLSGTLDFKLVAGSNILVTKLDLENKQASQTAQTPSSNQTPAAQTPQQTPPPPTYTPSDDDDKNKKKKAGDIDDSNSTTTSSDPTQTPQTNPPSSPDTPGSSGAGVPNSRPPLLGGLTSPKFIIPAAGIAAAALTIGLLSLPPASRHL